MTRLDPATEAVVRRAWAERIRVDPSAFDDGADVVVERPELTAVVAVRLGGASVVVAPGSAVPALRDLAADELADVPTLLRVLAPLRPTPIGAASLSFADMGTVSPTSTGTVREATEADVDAVLSRCSADERDESGLLDMVRRWVAAERRGEPRAAAGYEVWGGRVAHIGVAVAAERRGHGLGASAASAAILDAIGAGLVPQWRCRLDHDASARLAERLGFVRLGEQVAIDLGSSGA